MANFPDINFRYVIMP
jgi:hypothetical protein